MGRWEERQPSWESWRGCLGYNIDVALLFAIYALGEDLVRVFCCLGAAPKSFEFKFRSPAQG